MNKLYIKKLTVFLCFFILVPISTANAQPPIPSAAEEGSAILKEKPFEGFKPAPRPEIEKEASPEIADSFKKAEALEKEGRYEEAKELYAKVIQMRDQIVTGAQANIQMVLQQEQDAQSTFEEAQKYQKEGNFDKAKEAYNKVLELAWDHVTSQEEEAVKAFEEAEKYDKEGDLEKAGEAYRKALELAK